MARAQKKVDMAPLKTGFKVPDIQLRMDQTYNRKPMIKGEGIEFDLTEEQELEYIKCAASCTYFLKNYYKITSLDEGFILFKPYKYQEELIEAFQNHRFNISLQSRQSGKCVDHDTMINVRHKVTGEIKNISIGEFHHMKEEREPIYYGNSSGINLVQLTRRESYTDGLASTVNRKFVRSYKVTDWEVLSDTGYVPIKSTHITTKYDMWYMKTANGKELICADDHIVFKPGNDIQKFVKNLKPGMRVMTDDGVSQVVQVTNLGNQKHMYDLQVDSENHRYYTDGILSHNTTVVAAFILWFVTFHASKEVVVVANKEKQAKEILARISAAYQDMPAFMQAGAVKYGSTEIEFDNKSKISAYATSPDAARGKSLSLLYVDEAAFVDCDYDFWDSVSPTVAQSKKSKIIMTSTPNGQRGLFYDLWKGAEPDENGVTNGFNLTKVTWRSVPLYAETEGWEAEKRRQLGDAKFDQEYDCSFLGSVGTLIPSKLLRAMHSKAPVDEPNDYTKIFYEYDPKHRYIGVADVGGGLSQDYSVLTIFDVTEYPYKIAAKYRNNEISPLLFPFTIVDMCQAYGTCPVLVETNNDVGGQCITVLWYDLEYEETLLTSNHKQRGLRIGGSEAVPGIKTTSRPRNMGCANLKSLIETGKLVIEDLDTMTELGTFILKNDKYQADDGCHDDCVMPLVLFSWLIKTEWFMDEYERNVSSDMMKTASQSAIEDMCPFGGLVGIPQEVETQVETTYGGYRVIEGTSSGMMDWMNH